MASTAKRRFSNTDLNALVDRAVDEDGSVIIKRPGRKDLIVMPLDRLRDIDATEYILSSPANRKRLLSAMREARGGKGRRMTVLELKRFVGLE